MLSKTGISGFTLCFTCEDLRFPIYQRGSIMAPHRIGVTLKSSQTPAQLRPSVSPPLSLLLTTAGTCSTQSTQLTGVSKYPDLGPSKLLILPSSHLLVTSQKRPWDCFEGHWPDGPVWNGPIRKYVSSGACFPPAEMLRNGSISHLTFSEDVIGSELFSMLKEKLNNS